jgi:PAS domain-containing protein
LATADPAVPDDRGPGDASSLKSSWKRFQKRPAPHLPVLLLDREGSIAHATPAARRLLEYPLDRVMNPCFFTHVHGQNLRRVMRDLAHMVCHRMQQTSWLLRLRTGNGRWRWYRAAVHNGLHEPSNSVVVRLRPL